MDGLSRLVSNARALVLEGYYDLDGTTPRSPSFLETLGTAGQPSDVIAEIKYTSPTMASGKSRADFDDLLDRLAARGPLGLSVLAEPHVFGGHVDLVRRAAGKGLPVLMKDIVVDDAQLDAAAAAGASAVLLIESVFSRDLVPGPTQTFVDAAHDRDLDAVLEVHTLAEWDAAVRTDADILGINNRDLATMEVDLGTVPRILGERRKDRPVIAMSGIARRDEIDAMRRAGADAALVGSAVMTHEDPAEKLGELLHG